MPPSITPGWNDCLDPVVPKIDRIPIRVCQLQKRPFRIPTFKIGFQLPDDLSNGFPDKIAASVIHTDNRMILHIRSLSSLLISVRSHLYLLKLPQCLPSGYGSLLRLIQNRIPIRSIGFSFLFNIHFALYKKKRIFLCSYGCLLHGHGLHNPHHFSPNCPQPRTIPFPGNL